MCAYIRAIDVVSNAFLQVKEDHQVHIEQIHEEHREHIKQVLYLICYTAALIIHFKTLRVIASNFPL